MAYTDIDDPSAFFQTTLYTGNGSNDLSITNGGNSDLQPDFTWLKQRDSRDHFLFNSVSGIRKYVASNTNAAEDTLADGLKSFDSDGFTIDDGVGINENNDPHVSWNWKAGTAFSNDASSTSVGSIDSAGSVSTTAGFSIISYTGTGSVATVAHGLGVVPEMIWFKNLTTDSNWLVYHKALGNTNNMYLDAVNATHDRADTFNDTSPTTAVFTVGTADLNTDGNSIIAYCFADVKGYLKIGSYEGNANADGTFIYTGFKPAWVMTKSMDSTSNWEIKDSTRSPFNTIDDYIKANASAGEDTGVATHAMDFLSNGFKHRGSNDEVNGGETYIFIAFAEQPFVTSTGVPATAR
jgi:hypothetical protein